MRFNKWVKYMANSIAKTNNIFKLEQLKDDLCELRDDCYNYNTFPEYDNSDFGSMENSEATFIGMFSSAFISIGLGIVLGILGLRTGFIIAMSCSIPGMFAGSVIVPKLMQKIAEKRYYKKEEQINILIEEVKEKIEIFTPKYEIIRSERNRKQKISEEIKKIGAVIDSIIKPKPKLTIELTTEKSECEREEDLPCLPD